MSRLLILCLCLSPLADLQASAQSPANAEAAAAETESQENEGSKSREERLADYLSGCKFVGRFTVDGRDDPDPKTEEYTISKCEKLPAEDMYRLTARIQYGDVDSEVPMELKILWSGETPVITLDALWIPGMGRFTSRVLIQQDRYSGTWQHGDKGGHLFGKIVQDES